ncbi:hypothetical protein HMPREF3226_00456 [Prevotella corporis]|uniref:Uncharacterized protein n=1 Tax=Prevotella corporis TaxID=28128 RepID=A0A133QK82_9BACT|nr:hypothetical protein HMPREF3226_00456 [Prevotella corporis]
MSTNNSSIVSIEQTDIFHYFCNLIIKTKDIIRFLLITAMSLMTLSGHAQESVYSFQIQR